MKKLFALADLFLARADWRDLALLKLCLFAAGVIAGLYIPGRHRKCALIAALVVFGATWLGVMGRLISALFEKRPHSGYGGCYVSDFEDASGVCAD